MKKILVFKLGAIGDFIMAIPAIQSIKEKYPDSEITLLTGRHTSELAVKEHLNVDRIMEIDERIFWNKKILPLLLLLFKLKKEKFEHVYNMHWSALFNIFFIFSGIWSRTGFYRTKKPRFLTSGVYYREGEGPYAAFKYLKLVGVEEEKFPSLSINEKAKKKISVFIKENRMENPVGIFPGGGLNMKEDGTMRRWPEERFKELVFMLSRAAKNVIILGSAAEKEIASRIMQNAGGRIYNMAGNLSLTETVALVSECSVVVSSDSGGMHIAVATGVPVVGVFGPTLSVDKVPEISRCVAVEKDMPCRPCYDKGSYRECPSRACLFSVTAEEVFDSLNKILKEKRWSNVN